MASSALTTYGPSERIKITPYNDKEVSSGGSTESSPEDEEFNTSERDYLIEKNTGSFNNSSEDSPGYYVQRSGRDSSISEVTDHTDYDDDDMKHTGSTIRLTRPDEQASIVYKPHEPVPQLNEPAGSSDATNRAATAAIAASTPSTPTASNTPGNVPENTRNADYGQTGQQNKGTDRPDRRNNRAGEISDLEKEVSGPTKYDEPKQTVCDEERQENGEKCEQNEETRKTQKNRADQKGDVIVENSASGANGANDVENDVENGANGHEEASEEEIPYTENLRVPSNKEAQASLSSASRRAAVAAAELNDDVLVGNRVSEGHGNFVTAYNMLTGIRVAVSRCTAKNNRPLTSMDFKETDEISFDLQGGGSSPSSKYIFQFKDYSPWVFRHLRDAFKLDPADYLMSLTSKYIVSELGSPGKSGSFFYYSRDYRFIIKTIHHSEHKLLRRVLRQYYGHVVQNPDTLVSQFYGLHRVRLPFGRKIHFVVMNNVFPALYEIHERYDLKGSLYGREYKPDPAKPIAVFKDLDWMRWHKRIVLGPEKRERLVKQLETDVRFLERINVMDYSLLVGVHSMSEGNAALNALLHLAEFGPQDAGASQTESRVASAAMHRNVQGHTAQKEFAELQAMLQRATPERLKEFDFADEYRSEFYFYSEHGGFMSTDDKNNDRDVVYYIGIIDFLTPYSFRKSLENFWKGLLHDRKDLSAVPAQEYGERFLKFIRGSVGPEIHHSKVSRHSTAKSRTSEFLNDQNEGYTDHPVYTDKDSLKELSKDSLAESLKESLRESLKRIKSADREEIDELEKLNTKLDTKWDQEHEGRDANKAFDRYTDTDEINELGKPGDSRDPRDPWERKAFARYSDDPSELTKESSDRDLEAHATTSAQPKVQAKYTDSPTQRATMHKDAERSNPAHLKPADMPRVSNAHAHAHAKRSNAPERVDIAHPAAHTTNIHAVKSNPTVSHTPQTHSEHPAFREETGKVHATHPAHLSHPTHSAPHIVSTESPSDLYDPTNLPSLPSLPKLPDLPSMPSFTNLPELPQFPVHSAPELPQLPASTPVYHTYPQAVHVDHASHVTHSTQAHPQSHQAPQAHSQATQATQAHSQAHSQAPQTADQNQNQNQPGRPAARPDSAKSSFSQTSSIDSSAFQPATSNSEHSNLYAPRVRTRGSETSLASAIRVGQAVTAPISREGSTSSVGALSLRDSSVRASVASYGAQ